MGEQRNVIGELTAAGVLAGVRWAYAAATSRTLEIFSEPDGHDAALLGNLRFTLFRDRLDRVFGCEAYELQPGSAPTAHLDLLYAELDPEHVDSMPRIAPSLVTRNDLTGSPGWAVGRRRFLLASCLPGQIDSLPWPRRSPTIRRVARQHQADPGQASLFAGIADEEIAGLEELLAAAHRLDLETFVVAHTLDPVSHHRELVFGRPRLNPRGGPAWQWYQDLLAGPPVAGGRRRADGPPPTDPDVVPDAPVRLRRLKDERPGRRPSGDM